MSRLMPVKTSETMKASAIAARIARYERQISTSVERRQR